VRPLVRIVGVGGLAAEQAEATGWATAWEVLRGPSLREAASPWGVVWVAVRRAILGEVVAGEYVTAPRAAWRIRPSTTTGTAAATDAGGVSVGGAGVVERPVSLDRLADRGYEPAAGVGTAQGYGAQVIDVIVSGFVEAGWCPVLARRVVVQIAATAPRTPGALGRACGWRHLAVEVGIAPWQARRATIVVLGGGGWPGLARRVHEEGPSVLGDRQVRRAIRSTLSPGLPTPARRVASA